MPYFSIIMPVYNGEKYVKRATSSILEQSFSDFELIIVDDGSIDKSKEICLSLQEKDDRINFLSQDNQGALLARKNGVGISSGKYILFIDCDDTFEPDALKKIYNNCEKQNPDVLLFNFFKIGSKSKKISSPSFLDASKNYVGKELFLLSIEFFGQLNSLCTKAVKSDVAKKAFSLYDCRLSMAEDLLISIQLFKFMSSARYTNDYLYNYIDNPNSSMHKVRLDFFSEYEFVYNEIVKMIEYYRLPIKVKKIYTEKLLVKIMADYFFYTFQKKIDFNCFIKLGEFISRKKYIDFGNTDIKLSRIWNVAYYFLKRKRYHFLYTYFYILRGGYIIKHLRRF